MDSFLFAVGVVCLVLGSIILLFAPKKLGQGQVAYGSYVMRWTLPVFLFIAGAVAIASSL